MRKKTLFLLSLQCFSAELFAYNLLMIIFNNLILNQYFILAEYYAIFSLTRCKYNANFILMCAGAKTASAIIVGFSVNSHVVFLHRIWQMP